MLHYTVWALPVEGSPEVIPQVSAQVAGQVAGEVAGEVTGEVLQFLRVLTEGPCTRSEAQAKLELKGQANFRDRYLVPALDAGLIECTIPDKPTSRLQKYRLTDKGRKLLGMEQPS
jgi:ATP-dependent DNA helicase RecG